MLYLCRVKPLRHYLRGFLIAAWAGDKIAEFSFPEISFHFSLRPWFFFVSPAYAGKSPAAAYACPGTQDHPRVCGEKPRQDSVGALEGRITPACAGKSLSGFLELVTGVGSPPHVRGKAQDAKTDGKASRITPACAGKSSVRQRVLLSLWDHPRMCGEKTGFGKSAFTKSGSPPHVRGKD